LSGTITALVVQKNNKERVNVYLDDEFAFGVTVNAALTLKKGQVLSDAEISQLKADDSVDKAYDQSLRYLSFRPRTVQEVRQYLQKKGISDENTEFVIERLTEQGYLNDAEFGRIWVNDRERLNPKGKRALQYELRQKACLKKISNRHSMI
jgi:regulatory protein